MTASKSVLCAIKPIRSLSKRSSIKCLLAAAILSSPWISWAEPVVSSSSHQTNQVLSRLSVAQDKLGIDADMVAEDDYYFRQDGRRVQYLRKQGVYILPQALDERQLSTLSNLSAFNAKQQKNQAVSSPMGLKKVKQHRLGSRSVVRLSTLSPQTFENTVKGAKPVLANAQGQGDIEVLPAVTLKLADNVENEAVSSVLQALQKRFNLSMVRRIRVSGHVYSLTMNETLNDVAQVFRLVRRLMKDADVAWAEPQFNAAPIKHALANDSLFTQQWHLHNTTQQGALCDADCDATLAWDSATGANTVIAIIDDGVQLDHPDLAANIWENTAEKGGSVGVDDDGNGYIDDIHGFDFVIEASSCDGDNAYSGDGDISYQRDIDGNYVLDDFGEPIVLSVGEDGNPSPQAPSNCRLAGDDVIEDNHGTAVAGIAAAVGNNNRGVTGVAYNAEILPIRAISNYDTEFVTQGVDFCARCLLYTSPSPRDRG